MKGQFKIKRVIAIIIIVTFITTLLPYTNYVNGYAYANTSQNYKTAKSITSYKKTGNMAQDIVGIAKTQKGQGEYARYYSSDKGRKIVKTVYGDYFNYDYEWCAVFVCWCARKAGISKKIIPYATYADPKCFSGKYYSRGKIEPKCGDIIFYGNSTHVGLVEKSKGGYVYTIEGNTSADSGGNGYVDTHKYKLTNSYIMGYVRPNYESACKHSKYNTTTGKCSSCGAAYIDNDKSKLSTSLNTSYAAKRFYKITSTTKVYKYPSTGAGSYATFNAGTHVQVLGTLQSNNWYKVKYLSYTGYVPKANIASYTPSKDSSTLQINDAKNEYSVKHKVNTSIKAGVTSNYPIRVIKVTIGSKSYSKTYDALYLRNITIQKATGFNLAKFGVGTHSYTYYVKDISGKEITKTGSFVVYDKGVSVPSITEKCTADGKKAVISTSAGNATLHYSKNGGSDIKTSKKSVEIVLNEGTTTVKAFVYVGEQRSANVKKLITLSKLEEPSITAEQQGKTGKITITGKGSIKYSTDDGKTYKSYAKPFEVGGNTLIKAYATQNGYIKSDVATYTTEYTEPEKPVVKIVGDDSKVAAGKTVTLNWETDKCAESYRAVLYDASDDEEIDSVTTQKSTVTFTIPKAAEYYVMVVASNEIGDSEASEAVTVIGKSPLTVKFIDQKTNDDEEENVLIEQKVTYGECCEEIPETAAPSRKGYTFQGWKDAETGTVSVNGYGKKIITADAVFEAQYEAKVYSVKIYDTTGTLLETQKVRYGNAVDTEKLSVTIEDGYEFAGWQVTSTNEGDSAQNITKVDSDMEIHAVAVWANPELPVIAKVESAKVSSNGKYVNAEVKLTTEKERDLSFYLIFALKAKDSGDASLEKTIYADRKITYLDAGRENDPSETTVKVKMPISGDENTAASQVFEPSTVEIAAVECKKDMTTGSALSEMASCEVVRDSGTSYYGDLQTSETKPEEKEGREITEIPTYRYREKERKTSGYDSLDGYTLESTKNLSTEYGRWQDSVPATKAIQGETYKTTVSYDKEACHRWYSMYCNCHRTCWKANTRICSSCKSKTVNKVIAWTNVAYCPNASQSDSHVDAYRFASTIKSGDANRYFISINGTYTSSFSAKDCGVSYFWKAPAFNSYVYRTKTVKSQNTFWKWGEWKTSSTPVAATADRELGETTYSYTYRDLLTPEEAVGRENNLDPDGKLAKHCNGKITGVTEDLSGKTATIMVYQANNTDPNKYQMQYVGHTAIGSGNSYDFSFIPSVQPSVESGNYIVALSIPGSTGLINIDKIEAPKAKHKVAFYYTDNEGNEKQLGDEQIVEDGSDAVIPEISDAELTEEQKSSGCTDISREGYYFIGWTDRNTNITEDMKISAVYVEMKNSVVFVDWINQCIDQEMVLTGTNITVPGVSSESAGHVFKGWKLPDGTVVNAGDSITVKGSMIIEAVYETDEYTVRFLGTDDTVLDTQKVKYGESAEPPEYTGELNGGEFTSWSTQTSWWNVRADVDVRPVINYSETAEKPEVKIVETEANESENIIRSVQIESDEECARIFYRTDGEEPTAENVQEFIETGACQETDSFREYTDPVTFEEDTEINAVAYVEGKNLSETSTVNYEINPEINETNSTAPSDEWEELKTTEIKASEGKDVEVIVSLNENPGLLGCSVLVSADAETFSVDADEYGDPVVVTGKVFSTGRTVASTSTDGWDATWYGDEQTSETGELFHVTLHVNEGAEEGMYPVSVFYAPEKTYNNEYDEVSLAGADVEVTSQASIDISKLDAKLSRTSFAYDGKACEPVVTIDGLSESEDFTVEYSDNVNVGEAKAVITGINTYVGSVEKSFTITQAGIDNAEVAAIESQEYTGKAIEPEVSVTFDGTALVKDRDYTVTYEDNEEIGTAKAKITGIGNFKGTRSESFEITGGLQYELDKALKEKEAAEKKASDAEKAKADAEADLKQALQDKEAAETSERTTRQEKEEAEKALGEAQDKLKEAEDNLAECRKELKNAQETIEQLQGGICKHVLVRTAAKAATCLEEGNNEYWTCSECGDVFKDEAGTLKTTVEDETISKTSHKIRHVLNQAGYMKNGEEYDQCEECETVFNRKILAGYSTSYVKSFKVSKGKKSFTASWKKQSKTNQNKFSGYQIKYSLKSNMAGAKTTTASKSSSSKKVTKLKAKKKYYVWIRTYVKTSTGTFYSGWSKKTVTTK